jgi:hypothetical protein
MATDGRQKRGHRERHSLASPVDRVFAVSLAAGTAAPVATPFGDPGRNPGVEVGAPPHLSIVSKGRSRGGQASPTAAANGFTDVERNFFQPESMWLQRCSMDVPTTHSTPVVAVFPDVVILLRNGCFVEQFGRNN